MHDVARLAGVSVASVSNFFHRPGKLSEATRVRIQETSRTTCAGRCRRSAGEDDEQLPWAVHALDPLQLDVTGG